MKIACIIIEDLQVAADYLIKCCEKSGKVKVMGHFPDVPSALEFLNRNTVDLLFLDVEMPGSTGFELLDAIAYKPKVILTTSKEKYAYNAFQYHVTDFLKKPFTYARFLEALGRVADTTAGGDSPPRPTDHLFVKCEGKLVRLNNDEICYVESMGDYVRFVTHDKKYLVYSTIKKLEDKIDQEMFFRISRSHIVNLRKIEDIRDNSVYVNGTELPIGKNIRGDILKKLTVL